MDRGARIRELAQEVFKRLDKTNLEDYVRTLDIKKGSKVEH